ncbi:DUF4910 domain-containing protein [Kordiimonas sp.]|uniref:DUF4910 domain-containing protein n=1 Tax=Kordiimonas sp. TaxID=1970157 RepID=UPI003B52762D
MFKTIITGSLFALSGALAASEPITTLISEPELKAVSEEISGVKAKRNLDTITLYHRMRASDGFNKAASFVADELGSYGYDTVHTFTYAADGQTMYGTQKSRLAWQVDFAELWELSENRNGEWAKTRRLADWSARPLTLALDSDSANVTADLIDIGAGTSVADYEGKDVKGKIVLTSSQPGAVETLAVKERGAVGILSYAANQKSAWWQLDDSLVRWGHLSTFRDFDTFAFMTTLGEARELKARLKAGERIRFHAKVEARREPGEYRIVSATLPGSDPALKNEEIVFSCHLDHPRPGANDNASGCVSILEAARSLKRLVADGSVPAPKRTIRFIWPSEIEATLIWLNAEADIAKNIRHVIHMDMVGGSPVTKAVFRTSRGPKSAIDASGDVLEAITDFVNANTLDYASGIPTAFPLASAEGRREPLLAQKEWLSMGSDHDVFASGSWGIPISYLHDWPDRYIHTTKDMAANIDPTKLKRAGFIGLTQALILASLGDEDAAALSTMVEAGMIRRAGELLSSQNSSTDIVRASKARGHFAAEAQLIDSLHGYAPGADTNDLRAKRKALMAMLNVTETAVGGTVYHHGTEVKGTMNGFGYSYISDKLGEEELSKLSLLKEPSGRAKSYEALNLVNGKRALSEIHDMLVAQFGPISLEALTEYFRALESLNVLSEN